MKDFFGDEKYKKIIIAFWITLIVAIITFVVIFITFSKRLRNTADMGLLTINTTTSVVPNSSDTVESTSTTTDKDINEVAKDVLNQISNETNVVKNNTKKEVAKSGNNLEANNPNANTSNDNVTGTNNKVEEPVVAKEEVKKELKFEAPTVGEIIVDYADESLVYSETLEEWTTHLGVDIKASKASAVVASEEGTIKNIKNDPRYGLTVTISHSDGYETVYSNLLSADFVTIGDKVEKGQTIGTIGESASFEVAQTPHLHFEVYKDGKSINPTTILK
ncbi:MAG: M23 family metallopeptidase [Clostridia bacterium]|nr:M23 family metallopeptidase [Clostridia bacterium]